MCRCFYRPKQYRPPYDTAFPQLNAQNAVPRDPRFGNVWHDVLGKWGACMRKDVDFDESQLIGRGRGDVLPRRRWRAGPCRVSGGPEARGGDKGGRH